MQIFETLHDPQLVIALKRGDVGVMPTDTVYGIVCSARNSKAVERLYAAKNREKKPGTLIAASPAQLIDLGLPAEQIEQVAHLWPNPISVVLSADEQLFYIHQGLNSLAVRVPGSETLRDILEQTGPLLTSSANQPGEPPATNMQEAQEYFGDSIDFYVDGKNSKKLVPSTVVRLQSDGQLEILRAGAAILKREGITV